LSKGDTETAGDTGSKYSAYRIPNTEYRHSLI
jgi:hypothetical protein